MTTKHAPRQALFIQIRTWHTWMGVLLSAFIVLVCATGIYLNHKDLFEEKKGAEGGDASVGVPPKSPALTSSTRLEDLPIGFAQAMAIAARLLRPDAALDQVQLKDEKGRLVYKVMTAKRVVPEREAVVDAVTGEVELKEKGAYRTRRIGAQGGVEGGVDWGRVMMDLHTGKFFGTAAGKLLVDLTSLVILVLTVSGVYLWWVPFARRRKSRQEAAQRAAAIGHAGAPVPLP